MRSLKPLLLASTAVLVFAPGALAQTTQAPATIAQGQQAGDAAARDQANQVQEVVVTGSRIARPNLDQPTPISTVSSQQIQNAGTGSLGDIIAQLPAVGFSGTTRSNSNNFGSGFGISQINLRDLGISRTLVLVDGQRHVAGDIFTDAVDVNSIPAALVDRVEVVTGGASAIYGSDAVTGVVNIITKKNFEGVEVEAQAGGYDNGFGAQYNVYGTVGHNFMDGRLNLTGSVFWNKQAGIDARNLPNAHNYGAITNPNDVGADGFDPSFYSSGPAITNNGVPDNLTVQNVGSEYVTRGGTLYSLETGTPLSLFNAAGQPVAVPARTGYNSFAFAQLPANCGISCYFTEDYEQLSSPIDDKGLDIGARYDFTPHLHGFIDVKYTDNHADNVIQPSYTFFDAQLQPDNAFITPAIRQLIEADVGADGAAAYPLIGKFVNNGRVAGADRETFRVVGGLSGDFDAKIARVKWDGAINYGRTDTRFENSELLIPNNFFAALDSVIDPATGQAACRIDVPSAQANGFPYDMFDSTLSRQVYESRAQTGCVPYNPFGINNGAALGYVTSTFITRDTLTQQVANLNGSFDTSRFFNLQGGPVGFAVGAEYRMERTKEVNDPRLISGLTENLATDSSGGFNVYEGYIEASAPIFRHFKPGLDELTLDGAYRASYYSTVGHTDAYKFSAVYGPVKDIKFRGTMSQAVRAPNITEAFSPYSATFFNIVDPCDKTNIVANINYATNCAAAGVPAGFVSNTNSSIVGASQGNLGLQPETSFSYTGGFVLQPRWVPRLSVTLDYYSIKIKNAISLPSPQSIINNCYNGAALDPQYCSLFTRGDDGNINSLLQTYQNASKLETSGLDLQVDYSVGIAGLTNRFAYTRWLDGRLSFSLSGNYVFRLRNYPFQNIPSQYNVLEGEVGDPKIKGFATISYQQGPLQLAWEARYLGRSANFNRDPTATDKSESTDIPFVEQQVYHNLIARYDLPGAMKGIQLFGGVNNVFGEDPPPYLLGTAGNTGGTADAAYELGRYIFGGIRIRR